MPVVTDAPNGWDELRDGRWAAARERFEAALAGAETAEAFEGLSWAAWWLDDGDAVFAAREARVPALQEARRTPPRRLGWPPGWPPTSSTSPAPGRWRAAGCGARTACSSRSSPGPSTAGSRSTRASSRTRRGDSARATELAVRATELGRRFGVADLEMLGLALEGATLVGAARVDDGMRCLDEATATALAGDATIPISGAWTFCIMVGACTAALDFERASEWCDRIAEFAERYGSRYMLAFCRAEYGAVDLWRGRWSDAEAMLEAAVEDYARSRPAWVGGPLVALAELRRRQGRRADAEQLLDRAGGSSGAHLCRARLALDRRRTLQARGAARAPAASAAGGPRPRSRAGARAARARAGGARRARGGRRGRRGAARGAAPGRDGGARRVRRPRRGRARLRPRRSRSSSRAARGRGRLLRAQRSAVRGRAGAARARDMPDRARPRRAGRARGDRRAGSPGRARRGPRRRAGAPDTRHRGRARAARGADPARARGARAARRRADQPPDRGAAGGERAHRAPARDEPAAQARPPLAHGRGGPRRSARACSTRSPA